MLVVAWLLRITRVADLVEEVKCKQQRERNSTDLLVGNFSPQVCGNFP